MLQLSTRLLMLLSCLILGCTTKSQSRIEAQRAFNQGQQQAIAQLQQQRPAANTIQVIGEVRNQRIEWTEGLTLSQAIVEAGYQGQRDPTDIVIHRQGQVIFVNPRDLLRGRDQLLQPDDQIEIRR